MTMVLTTAYNASTCARSRVETPGLEATLPVEGLCAVRIYRSTYSPAANTQKRQPMAHPNLIAITDKTTSAGAIVLFRMSGPTDYETFKSAWIDSGLDPTQFIRRPSLGHALEKSVKQSAGTLLPRRLPGVRDSWALVMETPTGGTLQHKTVLHITLSETGRPIFTDSEHRDVPASTGDHSMSATAEQIRSQYDRNLDALSTGMVSQWLIDLCKNLNAVAVRDTGGIYFLPPRALPAWAKITKTVRSATNHEIIMIPAMPADETVRAVLECITQEAETSADRLYSDVEKGLGDRALKTRANQAAALREKVAEYEELLGVQLTTVREKLKRLKGSLMAATLLTRPDDPSECQ